MQSYRAVIDGVSARLWLRDGDRGWEHVVRVLAHAHRVLWEEYWPFLGIMFVWARVVVRSVD
jgi:hypothetical protein